MKTAIMILAVVAALQLVAAVALQLDSPQLATSSPQQNLLNFETGQVDSLSIRSSEAAVVLKRNGSGAQAAWLTQDGFPVDHAKLTQLLETLQGLKSGLAVATTDDAAGRFKVADDEFERHVELQQDGKTLADFYIGSGAGARRSHLRLAGSPAIYSVNVGSYDVPATAADWQDKAVLQLKADSLKTLQLGELQLQRDEAWTATAGLPAGRLLNPKAVDEALAPLLSLRFAEVLGKDEQASYGLE
ncbi:MAG: DUF4340 domain-containing protein, partial [Thiolinea sp.]